MSRGMTINVLSYNTLYAGYDGGDPRRARAQISTINEIRPDVFLMQEAKGFDSGGGARLHELEAQIGMRGFLSHAPRTGQNVAIFIRDPLRPLSFETDAANFHHALAVLRVEAPGAAKPLTFISAHLCPHGAEVRRREAAYLGAYVSPVDMTLVAGDFNSASPHDADPGRFDELPAHHRARYLDDKLQGADRTVLARLEAAGWVDVGDALDAHRTPTVPTPSYKDAEFAVMRCDYMLATKPLAAAAKSYAVVRTPETDWASDHYPIVATFDLSQ